ncbi:Uncharacterized protein FKW44_013136 [Caligus rogercresseyi]|uniref:Uncharacterized protein n=1 Tax=Caligus rogercresseyi TaxID=217165 RepID=A0A7T8KB63_CALRO|nr:Uncharacterized protein FKW44_013136 [Caligus rogercresseyi]
MEQTRRDTVIELLCAGHCPAAIIKLLKYPGGRSTTSPRSGRSQGCPRGRSTAQEWPDLHAHIFGGLKRSIKANPGTPMSILGIQELCPEGQLVQSWLKKNVPNFWDFSTWPPNSPDLNPCDYYM